MKDAIAIMLGKHGSSDSSDSDEGPGDERESSADESTKEELGTAVAEALSNKDPKALYNAIEQIAKYCAE